jgi:cysteine desulfurase/selenocysteine lyase
MTTTTIQLHTRGFEEARVHFPALEQLVYGKPLVYLDSAARALVPRAVIDAVVRVYEHEAGNVHRAVHLISQRTTELYEAARERVARFLGAASAAEIVFTRGTTESINLVAQTWGRQRLRAGDEILISGLEHHSNIVPWQLVCEQTGAKLVVAPVSDDGDVPLSELVARMSKRCRIVAVAHVSNALGTVLPIADIAAAAHERGAVVLVDGAQAAPHVAVDVAALGCDFYAFSGHKLYGPTGIGVLYGKHERLEAMPPYQGGGEMIRSVTFERTTYNDVPLKFEAGTPNIAGAVGLGAAIEYLEDIGMPALEQREQELLAYLRDALSAVPGLRLLGSAPHRVALASFVMDRAHPHDIGTILDAEGVAIRAGHHCAQPLMQRFGVPATARASLGMYNTRADIDALVRGLDKVRSVFS